MLTTGSSGGALHFYDTAPEHYVVMEAKICECCGKNFLRERGTRDRDCSRCAAARRTHCGSRRSAITNALHQDMQIEAEKKAAYKKTLWLKATDPLGYARHMAAAAWPAAKRAYWRERAAELENRRRPA